MPEKEKNTHPKPVILIVLDGWGIGEKEKGNPLLEARLPVFDKLDSYYPKIALQASGISVGLPWGEPGNSEVGHMTLGTGKVIYQNLPKITMSIQNGEFYENSVFLKAIENATINHSSIHLIGLVGKGTVHSDVDHLYALLELMQKHGMVQVFLHLFTDGRDSSPTSGKESIRELQMRIEKYGVGKIASISGRYFGMDRNNNWDRIKKSYDAMVNAIGEKITDPEQYLAQSYKKEIYDEYIEPAVVFEGDSPVGQIRNGDSVIFFNYREDRARQISKAFVLPGFSKFSVEPMKELFFVTMTQYEENLPVEIAFPPVEIKECLGKILSQNGLSQLRIAETEKFAHVTYFFNGGNEEPFPKEDRIIIPSKDVPTFEEAPEMSAREITQNLIEKIEKNQYDFILLNFANADIVGHTGNKKAAIKAVEVIDECMEKIIQSVIAKNGCLLITADHGNVEEMSNNRTGETDTKHSSNPVPLWYVTAQNHSSSPKKETSPVISGLLSDIAPTILDILEIKKPEDMTGESLLSILK